MVSGLSFTEALDQALELLEQGHPLEYCVRQFPEYSDELRPLLLVSDDLRRLADAPLPIFEKMAAEPDWDSLLANVPQATPSRLPAFFQGVVQFFQSLQQHPVQRYASLAAALVILCVLSLRGSERSTPESPLYQIKRTVEQVEVVTARDAVERVELRIEFARRRLDELRTLAYQTQRIEEPWVTEVLVQTTKAVNDARASGIHTEFYSELATLLSETDQSIAQLKQDIAGGSKPLINAQAEVDKLRSELDNEVASETGTAKPTRTPEAPTPSATSGSVAISEPTASEMNTVVPTARAGGDVPSAGGETPVRGPTATPRVVATATSAPPVRSNPSTPSTPTATLVFITATPTDTPVPPTDTPVPPTNTSVPPANTAVPPTNTPVPTPTNTSVPTPTVETPGATVPVHPILECVVTNSDGSFTAYFGYKNENAFTVVIPIGQNNRFFPAPDDRGQPTTFLPGRSGFYPNVAFSVVSQSSPIVWVLNGRTSTASNTSQTCGKTDPLDGAPEITPTSDADVVPTPVLYPTPTLEPTAALEPTTTLEPTSVREPVATIEPTASSTTTVETQRDSQTMKPVEVNKVQEQHKATVRQRMHVHRQQRAH